MNLNNIREGELGDIFDSLEEAFDALEIDYYLIGALARDIWYVRGNKPFRTTKDVDFAILIGSVAEYDAVKQYLKDHRSFEPNRGNSFVMRAPSGTQVDILPFGEIEINDGVEVEGTGLTSIKVNGFMEVYRAGTEEMEMKTGHSFKVATLQAIVLLKFIAYDDRPEQRSKDARDIANILLHFFDLQADLIYEHHNDLFGAEERSLEEISAIVIGREMKRITGSNKILLERLQRVLAAQIETKDGGAFVRNMVNETNKTAAQMVKLLEGLLAGLMQETAI